MHPFTGISNYEQLKYIVNLLLGNIKDTDLEACRNSTMKEGRQVPSWKTCCVPTLFDWKIQDVQSLRQRHITDSSPESRINLYPNALDSLSADYSMPFELPTMEIKINNLCNLKCRMCNPLDSTNGKDWE